MKLSELKQLISKIESEEIIDEVNDNLKEEGVGYVYAEDREKDPKSIKKEKEAIKTGGNTKHWTINYASEGQQPLP